MYDFRSDTVTKPTPSMRQAMFDAEVGDDVYGDDVSVNALETAFAKLLGHDAALFVPSGTMGNQLALMSHTQPGDEIIIGEHSHIKTYEVGAAGVLSQVVYQTFDDTIFPFDIEALASKVRKDDIHFPVTRLVVTENPHGSGRVQNLEAMKALKAWASKENLPVHMDGARLFNAAHHLNVSPKDLAMQVDSLMVCLSKGLGAPVGSMLIGSKSFIARARKYRKMLGGGMRQAGVLAAPAHVALQEWQTTIARDHAHAKTLRAKLDALDGIDVDFSASDTNMVFIELKRGGHDLIDAARAQGILLGGYKGSAMRIAVHRQIDAYAIDRLVKFFESYCARM